MLNNYFSEIGQKLAANIELTNSANIRSSTSFITQRCTFFYLQPIRESDILKHTRQLNPSKSTGPDGIPIKYIAMNALIIAPVLTRLYNSCISTGTYPRILQHVCSKLSNGSWALLKLRNYVDTTTLKTVYYALIYSYLQYCVSTWGLASTTVLDPLVRIHKRIIRIITNSLFLSHTNPLSKIEFLKNKRYC